MSAKETRPARLRTAKAAGRPVRKVAAPAPAKSAVTTESVAARMIALPQPQGTIPALWRKAELRRGLSRDEKKHLDAALARLQEERQLVALVHGKNVFFAFAEPLRESLDAVAAPAAGDDLREIYRRLVRESGGFPDVKILLLARALGPVAARGLPERLTALWRTGDATLSLGDWSLASEETRAAAVEMDGERYLLVRLEEATLQ